MNRDSVSENSDKNNKINKQGKQQNLIYHLYLYINTFIILSLVEHSINHFPL